MKNLPLSRAEFLRRSAFAAVGLTLSPAVLAAPAPAPLPVSGVALDLREFIRWVTDELEPAIRRPGGAGHYAREVGDQGIELYGVADMACILYTLGRLHPAAAEREQWRVAFERFQNPSTGWLVEKSPTHHPLHNTAFALAAMELLDLQPRLPVQMGPGYADPEIFLRRLDWKKDVYPQSHQGAGVAAIFALTPQLRHPEWFRRYFAACDRRFDSRSGLMGEQKPANGDADQIGGTFHYSFLYENFNRHMPYPEARIDAVLRLQQPDGYWMPRNHLWMTLDAIYLMTRSLRYCPHRFDDVRTALHRTLQALRREVYSPAGRKGTFVGKLTVHSVTAALSIAAEAQRFLGASEVITEEPLSLVLDRRPFI